MTHYVSDLKFFFFFADLKHNSCQHVRVSKVLNLNLMFAALFGNVKVICADGKCELYYSKQC